MAFKKRKNSYNRKKDFPKYNKNKISDETQSSSRTTNSEYRRKDQLSELDLGITEYVSNSKGFSGIIKARYSDFQVNEIDLEGNVAKLTDTSMPKDFNPKLQQFDYSTIEENPIENITQEQWVAMKNLVQGSLDDIVKVDVDNLDKEARKNLHQTIGKYFGRKIQTNTLVIDGKSVMQIKKYNKDVKERLQWPQDKGDFVHFILYKQMLDTMETCLKIGHLLNIPPGKISYAGVKDRRAKTTQWFCVRRIEPWKLITKINCLKNIKVGNIKFKDTALKLGDLSGNRFRIALRNVLADDDIINESMENLKRGFINYYGNQRFGNDKEAPTFLIGNKLLLGEWKQAVDLILKLKSGDDPSLDLNKAKMVYFETRDAKKALQILGKNRNSVEAKLLEGIANCNAGDYVNALEKIPRNMRLMYIHSFQSLIFNKMVSKRIQEFGLKVVEGDLVLLGEEIDIETDDEARNKPTVKALTSDDVKKYQINNIVMPLPGYDIVYPENMKIFYKQTLEEYGLSLEMPKQSVKSYNLSGTYRKMLGNVDDLSWKVIHYNNPNDDLIRSDFEELKGFEHPKSVENGQYKALVLDFTLKPSCYATMVLREVLKCDTSSYVQSQKNNYSKEAKTGKIIVDGSVDASKDDDTETLNSIGLLADKEKYEDFKKLIFDDVSEPTPKRKTEETENDMNGSKKIKCDVNN